jgi:hypothetical protein
MGEADRKMRNRWLLFALMAALAVGLVACSSNKETQEAAPQTGTSTQPPGQEAAAATETPAETAPAEVAPVPAEQAPSTPQPEDVFARAATALEGLTSYEYTTAFLFVSDAEETEPGSIELSGVVAGADQRHMVWRDVQTDESFEVTQIGDQAWIRDEEGWEEVPVLVAEGMSQVASVYAPSVTWGGLFGELQANASYLGREQVDGVSADHYTATYTQWGAYWQGELIDATGDVWIAEAGYPVKYSFEATGVDEDGVRGHVTWTMDLTHVNEPLTVEPPQ